MSLLNSRLPRYTINCVNVSLDPTRSPRRALSGTVWSCALLVLAVLAGSAWFLYAEHRIAGQWGFSLDDSWIYATFARNVATGQGYSFNPGERVAGATGPLYALILALGYTVFHDVVWCAKLLGIACLAGASVLMYLAMRTLDPQSRVKPLMAGLLVGISPSLLWAAVSGMEVTLFLLLACLGIYYYTKERWTLAALCWSIGVWVRPDALLLVAMGVFLVPRITWKGATRRLLMVGAVLAAFFIFNSVVGETLLPNSVLAKTHFGRNAWAAMWEMILESATLWGLPTRRWEIAEHAVVLLPAMMVGAITMVRRFPALGAYAFGLPLALAIFGAAGGQYGRYIMPTIPFGMLLGVFGLDYLAKRLFRRRHAACLVVLALVCVAWQIHNMDRRGKLHGWNVENINDMQRFLAEAMSLTTSPGDTIAVNDIGAMGYFSKCYVLDLAGLISPLRPLPENLALYRPKFMVIFPSWFQGYGVADPRSGLESFYDADSMYKYIPVGGAGLRFNTICSRDIMLVYARLRPGENGPDKPKLMWH